MAEVAASVYLDKNFFIRAVQGTKEAAAPARGLIEVLDPSQRADALGLDIKRRAYLDLLLWSKFIGLVPVNRSILIETADLRAVSPLKLPHAIHLTSAIQSGCQFFCSADKDFKKLPVGMKWINFDDGTALLIREFT